jgi:hypothetical protein
MHDVEGAAAAAEDDVGEDERAAEVGAGGEEASAAPAERAHQPARGQREAEPLHDAEPEAAAVGLGRIVALRHRSSTSYQIC